MLLKPPIGLDDFKKLIEDGYTYVDKSLFIEEVLEHPAQAQLILRPRRFGKTLNMSMLKHFLDIREDNHSLFQGLNIEKRPSFQQCGQHPVLFISFKDLQCHSFETFLNTFNTAMADLIEKHDYLKPFMTQFDQRVFEAILEERANEAKLMDALTRLLKVLQRHHNKSVFLLIDEYDSPIIESYGQDYYEQLIIFMRGLLGRALKGNPALEKAVLTGILRVSKESIFSGLNNVSVYGVQDIAFADKFGFTETETLLLLEQAGLSKMRTDVQDWYNGYQIGAQVIYNPWSMLKLLEGEHICKPYWVNTSDNQLIHDLLLKADGETQNRLFTLMQGDSLSVSLRNHTAFRDLDASSLWTLLAYSGYLTITAKTLVNGEDIYKVRIPNREVFFIYRDIFLRWFGSTRNEQGHPRLVEALLSGDVGEFGNQLENLVASVLSYYDTAGPMPERIYHAFVLGLLSTVRSTHHIRSNRESGFGRYDVMMIPKDKSGRGIVIEFKTATTAGDLESALEAGLAQLKQQNYRTELEEQEVSTITEIAVAFCGKQVKTRERCVS